MRDITWNCNLSLTKKCDEALITTSEKFSKNFANCISVDSVGYTSQLQCFNMLFVVLKETIFLINY